MVACRPFLCCSKYAVAHIIKIVSWFTFLSRIKLADRPRIAQH